MGIIDNEVANILDEYSADLDSEVQKVIKEVADETVEKLRSASAANFGNGPYAKGWAIKADNTNKSYIIHNKKHYRLTHLLEHGHAIISHGKAKGRYPGKVHIKPVEEEAKAELARRLQEAIGKL